MYPDATTAGSWTELTDRLDRQDVLKRWSQLEPALAAVEGCEQLRELLRPGVTPARADELLGALVRLGAAAGGDDQDAVLLLLHLLAEGATALARRLSDLSGGVLALVVGELTVQIRAFPFERRTRAYAANLLCDTRLAVLRELLPHRTRSTPNAVEVLFDPTDPERTGRLFEQPANNDDDLDLLDLLVWAERTGVVDARGVAALLATEAARQEHRGYAPIAAAACGISSRTSRRHRRQALTALRGARDNYLAACA